jgi:hypothetical protein
MIRRAAAALLLAIACTLFGAPVFADDPCMDFKWDVTQERALFAGPALSLAAGSDSKSAPIILPKRLYQLQLMPQSHVSFAAAPGKQTQNAEAYAGLAILNIPASGSYRVALDAAFWIDLVSDGALVAASDYQGQHDCSAPHKIVEFALHGTRLILQLSGSASERVRVSITPTPVRKL